VRRGLVPIYRSRDMRASIGGIKVSKYMARQFLGGIKYDLVPEFIKGKEEIAFFKLVPYTELKIKDKIK